MLLYRIAKTLARAKDVSGTGAFQHGGRWNSKGTYMLYCSENSSLAYLENLVHFDESDFPPHLFIAELDVRVPEGSVYQPEELEYPADWQQLDHLSNKLLGDSWMREMKFVGYKIKSAINPAEFNYLLNPVFPGFHDLVKISTVNEIKIDTRLVKS